MPNIQQETTPEFFSHQVHKAQRFYLDLAPPASHAVSVVCGGREHCVPHYAIHRSDFPYYSIELVARGHGALTLAGRDFALTPGTVFTYGPGVPHDITADATEPPVLNQPVLNQPVLNQPVLNQMVKYFVDFTGRRALPRLRQLGLTPGTVGQVFAPGELQGVFDDLIQNGLKNTRYSAAICAAIVEHLMLKTAELLLPSRAAQTPAFATYQRCRQYIQANCEQLRTITEIARRCHVDSAYLCRLFRRYDHQTPYQFLMRLKMNIAAVRLQDPGTLVKQVAAELEFDDAGHFSRAFKSVFGLSPEAFRRLR